MKEEIIRRLLHYFTKISSIHMRGRFQQIAESVFLRQPRPREPCSSTVSELPSDSPILDSFFKMSIPGPTDADAAFGIDKTDYNIYEIIEIIKESIGLNATALSPATVNHLKKLLEKNLNEVLRSL